MGRGARCFKWFMGVFVKNRSTRIVVIIVALVLTLTGVMVNRVEAQVPPIPSFLGGKIVVSGLPFVVT